MGEDMVDTVLDTGATDMVTILARDPLMPNPKLMLMPDTCTEVTASDMDVDTDMEDSDTVIMVLDTAAAMLVCTGAMDMVDTVLDLDTEDMAASGVRHLEV